MNLIPFEKLLLLEDLNRLISKAKHKPGAWFESTDHQGLIVSLSPEEQRVQAAQRPPGLRGILKGFMQDSGIIGESNQLEDAHLAIAAVNALPELLALAEDGLALRSMSTDQGSLVANDSWVQHAYPLQKITVQVQGTRHSNRQALISELETALERLKRGDESGESHDDDFGYRFFVQSNSRGPSFFDTPAGEN